MLNSFESEKRFWRRRVFLIIGAAVLYASVFYLVSRYFGYSGGFASVYVLIMGAISVLILLPFFRSKLWRREKSHFSEYDKLEENFEKTANDEIINKLGEGMYTKLYTEDLYRAVIDGISICQELLSRDEVRKDDNLKFYIYVRIASYFVKDEQYNKAVHYLKEALSLKPDHFLVNLKLAEVHEWGGAGTDAIRCYETALATSTNVSTDFKAYIRSQIARVKIQGPRKRLPRVGFTHLR